MFKCFIMDFRKLTNKNILITECQFDCVSVTVSNSTVDHFDTNSLNSLVFCNGCLMTKLHLIRDRIIFVFLSVSIRYNKSDLIDSISTWSTVGFEIKWKILREWMEHGSWAFSYHRSLNLFHKKRFYNRKQIQATHFLTVMKFWIHLLFRCYFNTKRNNHEQNSFFCSIG